MNRPLSFTHSTRTVCSSLTWPLRVADELLRLDEVLARVVAEQGRGFFLAVVELVDLGPLRPGIVRRARPAAAWAESRTARGSCSRGAATVPTQSVPVSPPPMTITSLPLAEM